MKKIGIITLMHGFNYGGMLQCYALQKIVQGFGMETQIIDYPMSPRRRKFRQLSNCLGQTTARWLEKIFWQRRLSKPLTKLFENFRQQELQLSQPIASRSALTCLSRQYDAIIVGSDQVWSQLWYTPEYFLDFAAPGVHKISYAACAGTITNISASRQLQLTQKLKDFTAISVRNQMTQALVSDLTGIVPEITADPTLLLQWQALPKPVEILHDHYILLYAMSQDSFEKNRDHIRQLVNELKLPLVAIKSDVLQPWMEDFADCHWLNPGVFDWVAAFQHADYIFTDSFHGTLFAANNRKPLWNYIGKQRSFERVAYIACRYHLLSAYCEPDEVLKNLELQRNPDYYDKVHSAIAEHRQFSMDWLRQKIAMG